MRVAVEFSSRACCSAACTALFALGQSLMFGVMRLTNTAQGDFIVLGAFGAIAALAALGPLVPAPQLALVLVGLLLLPVAFGVGYALQRGVLNGTLGRDPLPSLVVTFGLSIVIQNALLELFSADPRSLETGGLNTASVALPGGVAVGAAAAGDLRAGGRRDRRPAMAVRLDRARPVVSCRLRRPRDRRADGPRREEGLWAGDRHRLRPHRRRGHAARRCGPRSRRPMDRCCCCSRSRP